MALNHRHPARSWSNLDSQGLHQGYTGTTVQAPCCRRVDPIDPMSRRFPAPAIPRLLISPSLESVLIDGRSELSDALRSHTRYPCDPVAAVSRPVIPRADRARAKLLVRRTCSISFGEGEDSIYPKKHRNQARRVRAREPVHPSDTHHAAGQRARHWARQGHDTPLYLHEIEHPIRTKYGF